MPPAFTAPLIGSSFDALNSQRYAWQSRNDQVEAANIARFNAAQENQNRYRFNVAQAQQEAMLRDAQARDAAARDSINLALGERATREDARRFDVSSGLRRNEVENDRRRYQFSVDREKRRLDEENKTVENFADEFRKPLFSIGKKRDSSQEEYMAAQQEFEQRAQELESLPSDKDLPPTATEEDRTKAREALAKATRELSKAQGRLAIAKETFVLNEREFGGLAKTAEDFGLVVKKDGDKYAFLRPRDRRSFGMYPDELVPQAGVGPAVAAPRAMPAFVPQTSTATSQPALPPATPLPRGGGTVMDFSKPKAGPKLTVEGATFFLGEAKGNRALAEQLAKEAGYIF